MSLRLSLAVLALAGCLEPNEELETSVSAQTLTDEDDWGCPKYGCGQNSPVIGALDFHELNELGLPNDVGYYIEKESFRPTSNTTTKYRLNVVAGQIRAYGSDGSVVAGKNLLYWRFNVRNVNNSNAYEVWITAIGNSKATPYWANPNHLDVWPWTYQFKWNVLGMGPTSAVPVCGEQSALGQDGFADFHAVVFEGDRIDATTKSVYGLDVNWFNIGCATHALAKQHLTAHTRAGGAAMQVSTTLDERTANLKMLTADYCGTGQTFTLAGEALGWKYTNGIFSNVPKINAGVEAVWSAKGAVCLNEPRIDWNHSTHTQTFPAGIDGAAGALATKCKRPPVCNSKLHFGSVTSFLMY